MKKLILVLALLCAVPSFTGCNVLSPKTKVTYEASVFLSFKDVWTVTRQAYVGFKTRQAEGKVSAADAADVDKAWNTFRGAYVIALDVAAQNENAFTPANVRDLANDVLDLIAATL
jgi:hypothetical protein